MKPDTVDSIQKFIALVIFLIAAFCVITHTWGCAAIAKAIPDDTKEEKAETAYLTQHLRCVEDNKDMPKAAEDACRANVRRRWCVTDAGAVGCKDGGQ